MSWVKRYYMELMHKEPDVVPMAGFGGAVIDVKGLEKMPPGARNVGDVGVVTTKDLIERRIQWDVLWQRTFPEKKRTMDFSVNYEVIGKMNGAIATEYNNPIRGSSYSKYALKDIVDVDKLHIPDVKSPIVQETLEGQKQYMDEFPEDLKKEFDLIDGQVGASPDEGIIAGGIMPYTPLLAAMRFHPQHVHKLFQLMTDFAIEGIKEQEKIVGKATRARLFSHMPTLLNREQYKEFWVPYLQQCAKEVQGAVVVWHNEGKSDHILGLIPREIDEWDTYCQTDLRLAKKIVGDRITFLGGIDPIEIMWRGTPADMDAAVKEIIAVAGPGGGLVVGRGGSQPYMRYEMYRAMIDAVQKYGRKPYPTDYIEGARLHRVTSTGGEISPALPVYKD